jgi:hypothetical protein
MPAAVVVLAAATGTSAAIGAGIATAIGVGTVSTAVATAIGTGVLAGGITAVQGGDAGDVLEAAVVGGVTSFVGGSIAAGVGETVAEVTGSSAAGQIAGNVAAAGVTSGGDEQAMLTAGLMGGINAGINAGRTAAVDEYLGSINPDPYGANYGEEFDYLAATGEPANASIYPPQDFGVPVNVDTPFYAADTTATSDGSTVDTATPPGVSDGLKAGMTAYKANPDGTFTYTYDDGSTLTIDNSSNVVGYEPSSSILQASPDDMNLQAEQDLNNKLAALDIAQRLAPTAVRALLAKNGSQSTPGTYGTAGALAAAATPAWWQTPDLIHQVAKIGTPKDEGEFESLLAPFLSKVEGDANLTDNKKTETAFMQPYFNYGSESPIDQILNTGGDQQVTGKDGGVFAASGGAISPLMGTGTRYGRYALGGMATPLMAAGGKPRVDFRRGDAVTGPGDGQSDDIPAMLADGEFVFPADVVAAIGNGSTKAGSDKLYDMMHSIRKHARSAKPKDLPPEIKSPLDFLKRRS